MKLSKYNYFVILVVNTMLISACGGAGGGGGGYEGFYASPVRVSETLRFTTIAAGYLHTCAISTSGDTYCWGDNEYDQLGSSRPIGSRSSGPMGSRWVPVRVDGSHQFMQLTASIRHTCALDATGSAYCWGFGLGGQLGDGQRANSRVPVSVAGGLNFTTLDATAASGATCGLTSTGDAWCWGINISGSLGNGTETDGAYIPGPVMSSLKFISISISDTNACALNTENDTLCWGSNWYGQLGVGSAGSEGGLTKSYTPTAVLGGLKFDQIVADGFHSCALQSDGAAFCWGLGSALGTATTESYVSLPMQVIHTGSPWVSLGVGYGETCALTVDGELYCWGPLTSLSPDAAAVTPVRINSNQAFVAFSVGGTHACAIDVDGFAYCWGNNNSGQVGGAPSDP